MLLRIVMPEDNDIFYRVSEYGKGEVSEASQIRIHEKAQEIMADEEKGVEDFIDWLDLNYDADEVDPEDMTIAWGELE